MGSISAEVARDARIGVRLPSGETQLLRKEDAMIRLGRLALVVETFFLAGTGLAGTYSVSYSGGTCAVTGGGGGGAYALSSGY